jgi:hypothetical protein
MALNFGQDAVAGRVGQYFQKLGKAHAFIVGVMGVTCYLVAKLDNPPEEVAFPWELALQSSHTGPPPSHSLLGPPLARWWPFYSSEGDS